MDHKLVLRFGLWLAFALLPVTAQAAEPILSLTTNPAQIPLCYVKQPVSALLTLQNTADNPVSDVCIKMMTNGPIQVVITGQTPTSAKTQNCPGGFYLPKINPKTSVARQIELTLLDVPSTTPQVILWADYQSQVADKAIRASSSVSMNTSIGMTPTHDNIKLSTTTSFTSLQENATGTLLFTIDNRSTEPLDIKVTKPLTPKFTKIEPKDDATLRVQPQSSAVLSFSIDADKNVTPGKYLGVLEVSGKTGCGIPIHRSISYEVTLGVFGQSELLTLLNIPSLLFLPGYLMLALWLLLWRFKPMRITWLVKAGSNEEFFVGLKDAEFWLLGITISLLLYFSGTPWLVITNVEAYSLRDIASLWTLSLLLSLLVYLMLLYINRLYLRIVAKKLAATMLTRGDNVITTMEKICRRKWDLQQRRAVKSKSGVTPELRGFLLWTADEVDSSWLIPQIIVNVRQDAIGDLDPGNPRIDCSTLLDQLKQIEKIEGAQVKWGVIPGLSGPIMVKNSEMEDTNPFDLVQLVHR